MRPARPSAARVDPQLCREIGERLRSRRRALRIQQRELARRLELYPSTLCKWETGRTPPSSLLLQPLAIHLGVSVEWILTGREHSDEVALALELLERLGGQEAALAVVQALRTRRAT